MAQRSFQEYVTDRFYNEMFSAIAMFLEENRDHLSVTSHSVRHIDSTELLEIYVKKVYIEDLSDMRIGFDVLVEAEFAISEIDRHNDRYDEKRQWFRISCNGNLNKHLGDFCISSVCEYDSRIKQNKPLDDALVPYINRDQYEAVARDFLERYYKEALYEPMYVDPTVLVERMGLTIRQRNITNDCSIFGQIFFTDCDTTYYDENREITLTEEVSAGTIYFDPEFYFLRNLGSVNNTIVHECVHWDKHRKAFELERLYNKEATQIRCQVVGGIKDSKTHTATDYMESQANSLTPRIQMPYTQAKVKAAELIRKYKRQLQTNQLVDVLEPVIDEMAIFFGVSRCAAKIRMVDIGYEEAIGVFTYIDGKYVRPHGFKKGSINKQQTFSISAQDAIIEGFFSEELREGMKQGKYQFIDSHYCLNSPKYIMQGEDKNPCLTEYARLHMDECCVIFDLTIKAVNKYSEAFYTECVLYRDAASNIVFEARYSNDNKNIFTQDEMISAYNKDILGVAKNLSSSFSGCLSGLIEWTGMTVEELAEASLIADRSIRRYKSGEHENPTLESVIALCIGMKLPPPLSYKLVSSAGFSFMAREKDIMYQTLLGGYFSHSIHECNELLIAQNMQPLGKNERTGNV